MPVRCKKGSSGGGRVLNLCFVVVVLVIVWGIILGDMCERGSFLFILFYDMRTASCKEEMCWNNLTPITVWTPPEGLVYMTPTTANISTFLWAPGLPSLKTGCIFSQETTTNKQLWGRSYFMKVHIISSFVCSPVNAHSSPLKFSNAPSQWILDSTSPGLLCLFTLWESMLSFLFFPGVVSPIPGVLNLLSTPRWCPHSGLTRPKTLQLNTCWHLDGASVWKLLKCHDSATVWHCKITSLVHRSQTISAILVHQPETVFTILMHIKDSLSIPLHCTSAHRPVSDCM